MKNPAAKLIEISRKLSAELEKLSFAPPVTHVYNPLVYARAPHELYLERYGNRQGRAVMMGMNPGPWGMAQTGVPFGEVAAVRDWLGIEAPVGKPENEHPKRPVDGFDCHRSEVSGRRVWGWAKGRFGAAGVFNTTFFVFNYCPLMFLEQSGRNRTPDKLPVVERKPLLELCDAAAREAIEVLDATVVIGIGRFAEDRLKAALAGTGREVGRVLHPSPASPAANRGWAKAMERDLMRMGICLDI